MNPFPAVRTLAFRPRIARPSTSQAVTGIKRHAVRTFADEKQQHGTLPESQQQDAVGPNMEQQEHVSEETAKMNAIMGKPGPDIEGQGTPVQEVGDLVTTELRTIC